MAEIEMIRDFMAVLERSGTEMIGKAAPNLMYFAGKDYGERFAAAFGAIEDTERAIEKVFPSEEGIWQVLLWKNQGQEDIWQYEVEYVFIDLVFRKCPIRTICLERGIKLGGLLCQSIHGYAAGCLQVIMGRRVDLLLEHAGPGACKVMLKTVE